MNDKENETGFASRLLHGAKELIWQDDPRRVKPAANTASAVIKQTANGATMLRAAPVPNGMAAELLSVVMNRPTAYSALAEAIAALSEIAMDEATRYRSAFAVLKKTQQRTVEQIAQAVDVHLSLLESEKARFSGQSKNAEDGEITARLNEVAALSAAIDQANEQVVRVRADADAHIKQLQEDMSKKQARAAELARETEEQKRAIFQTTQNFERASEVVSRTLREEKSRIQQYLG